MKRVFTYYLFCLTNFTVGSFAFLPDTTQNQGFHPDFAAIVVVEGVYVNR